MKADAGDQGGPVDLGLARVSELDRGGMLGAIDAMPDQLETGLAAAEEALRPSHAAPPFTSGARIDGVVVCGMGGSAIGADLVLAAAAGLPVPAAVVRGYELPAWVSVGALVVLVSYSGDTEETLACAAAALQRGCTPVCVCTGGRLADLAADCGLPHVSVPGGCQPRAALGHLAAALLAVLCAAGLMPPAGADVRESAALLRDAGAALQPDVADPANPAKKLARRLHRRQVVVCGAGLTAAVARRWKGQINENAKAPAFWNELPEMDHNELEGWTSLPHVAAASSVVFLDDPHGDPRLLRRAELTAAELSARGVACERLPARGGSRLARAFSLVQLGDYVSFYLALLYGVDPTPVNAIQGLKARLSGDL